MDDTRQNDTRRAWRKRVIRDSRTGEFGLVIDVRRDSEEGVRTPLFSLVVRFPSDPKTDRYVALYETEDLEYLVPDNPNSRYRLSSLEAATKDRAA